MLGNTKKQGFTVVELLIVIVVIAILAAISLVAYNGIRERSLAAHANATVRQWLQLIQASEITGGESPYVLNMSTLPSGYSGGCLGRSIADFPATSQFAAGECLKSLDGGMKFIYIDSHYDTWPSEMSRPNGLMPVSKFTGSDSSSSFIGRGVAASMLGPIWVSQIQGDCRPGVAINTDNPGSLLGGLCRVL